MKNYYELLEVDKQASSEVIDKAYKVLAKKYHPDANPDDKKVWAEEQFKKINEAYEILSDDRKRNEYDQQLANTAIDYHKKYEQLRQEQEILKRQLEELKIRNQHIQSQSVRSASYGYQASPRPETSYRPQTNPEPQPSYIRYAHEPDMDDIRKEEFARAYNSILQSLGYTIRQKKTWKDFIALVLTILILIGLATLLWHIPVTKNYLISFYESNDLLQSIVHIFIH